MNFRAILFDFDGVILKSMEQHYNAWKSGLAQEGVDLHPDDFFILEGQGIDVISNELCAKNGLDASATERVMKRKSAFYKDHLKIEFYEYFFELLNSLKARKIPVGIVTGGNRERVMRVVDEYLKEYFEIVVTVDDVKRGKPHPEPFLKGAALLGVSPGQCVVIENAPMGVRGAKAAGMYVIAITTTMNPAQLSEADEIVSDFKAVERVLMELF